jgi:hypothetical protein
MRYVAILAGIGLLLAVTATAGANTVASSTMWFDASTLTESGGVYTGVANMVNEDALNIGDDVAGFDVYARNGAWATYDLAGSGQNYTAGQVSAHDAYQDYAVGGWGAGWDPDCGDWYQYSLDLTTSGWALRNHAGSTAGAPHSTVARGVPMSGSMNWTSMIATETDTGAYLSGMGTPESANYAANFAAGKGQSTAGAWDMDWSWGSDYVPLQYADFSVEFITIGGSDYVTMTPVPEPVTMAGLMLGIGCLARYARKRRKA